ncbi:tetratricopeptide repeat protein [Micromonospora sp. NPDC023737]|uniref:tetratricopeptide repeat protein n=1 Tax=unclassified Micromonospora TaxID=2617518 RepID=UPI0033D514BC
MPSGFGELTDQAHHLVSTGDLAGAQRLLSDALSDADPRPANATTELAEAASLQARVLVALGEPHSARGWAAFAYAAHTRLHGRSDPRTVAAAATLAAVLHRVGSHPRAARLYRDVIIELTAQDGPESLRVLAAHADLATVEYARGQCRTARDRLQDAWELHREVYGDGHPSGIKMLARLGAMQRDCGQFGEAHDSLALARELCRQHLAGDDPLAGQVATLARAAANPDHVCSDSPPAAHDAPVVPAARTPSYGDTPGYPPSEPEGRTVPVPRQPVDDPAGAEQARAEQAWWSPDSDQQVPGAGAEPPGGSGGGAGTLPPHGDARLGAEWTTSAGDGPPPLSGTEAGGYPPVDDAAPPAGSAVPPAVMALGGGQQEADGVHRVRRDVEPYEPSRLLPVPVRRTPSTSGRRLVTLVIAGVAVVLLGAAAVIAGVSRVGGDDPPPELPPGSAGSTPTSTTASRSAAASPTPRIGAPPAGVDLRDNRDNVALRWTYPAGGEGPVVISGGRAGQPKSALTDLPAGTSDFVVYGLSPSNDYCFTVAVVWSTDTVATADEICTHRR